MDNKFANLRRVRGERIDQPGLIYHIRTSTIDQRPWLARKECANIFIENLFKYREELEFKLFSFVVMPEHIHLVLMPKETAGISKIMMNLKRRSAWEINQFLKRKGPFWRDDYFDHWERKPEQVAKAINYLHGNPVRRGLVEKAEDYPYSSCSAWDSPEKSVYKIDQDLFW